MAKLIVKSAKFGIVVKELDTADYKDRAALFRDLSRAIPEADWWEERQSDVNVSRRGMIIIENRGLRIEDRHLQEGINRRLTQISADKDSEISPQRRRVKPKIGRQRSEIS